MSRKSYIFVYALTLVFALAVVLWPVISSIIGDELGYSILNYYILFPSICFFCGAIFGIKSVKYSWIYLLLVVALGIAMPYLVFHSFGMEVSLFAAFTTIFGLAVGLLARFVMRKTMKK